MSSKAAKVHFKLQQAGGYPPVAVESVWATAGNGEEDFVLDNIPFFARDATLGDLVQVQAREGNRWFTSVITPSLNSLVRAVFFDPSHRARVENALQALGCSTEYLSQYTLLAINIPATTDLDGVRSRLEREARSDILDYEEPILRQ